MTHLLPAEPLDPEAPGLDEDTRFRRRRLVAMAKMSPDEFRALAVRAGVLTPEGDLTAPYQDQTPSPYRDALMGSGLDLPILRELCAGASLRPSEIAAALGQRWAVSENEVWGRLRRLASRDPALVTQDGVGFSVTEAGREAVRER
jgi:hypothetical protein